MKSRASIVLVLCAIALLLLGAWWWLRATRTTADPDARDAAAIDVSEPRTASLEPVEHFGESADAAAPVDVASRSRVSVGAPTVAQIRLRVRSSVGLPLARVEIRDPDGLWVPHTCRDGVATIAAIQLPLEARAPGHAARRFETVGAPLEGVHELLLEPESLLVIDDPARLAALPNPMYAAGDPPLRDLTALATLGMLDTRRLAIAFDSERMQARGMREFEFALSLRTCEALGGKVRLANGLRAHGSVPEGSGKRAFLPLIVRLHPDSPRGGPWTLRLVDAPTPFQTWIRADGSDAVVGELQAQPKSQDATIVSETGVWRIDSLVVERDYSYALFDRATGAHATGTLRHLGEPIELRLSAGCAIAGRVAVPPGSALPATVDISVQWSEPPSRARWRSARSMWNTQTLEGVPLAADGSFEAACFDAISDAYDGRALLSVEITSAAHVSGSRELEVARAPRHELGTIELTGALPGITLASDASIWPRAHVKTWASAAGIEHDVIRIPQQPDGSFLLQTAQAIDAHAVALRWSLRSRAREHLFLERDLDVYRPAKTQRRHVELAIQPNQEPDRFWRLALSWRDTSVELDELRATQAGEVLVRDYHVPDGTCLTWTPFRQLDAGVSPPLGPSQSVALDVPPDAPAPRAVLR